MPVAKSYLNCKIISEPFTRTSGGKKFVNIEYGDGSRKTVRWYTDAEWIAMYPDMADLIKKGVNRRNILGFGEAGFITIYFGSTYENLEWFKSIPECRYNKIWGWYTVSEETVPEELPEGVETAKLLWEDVIDETGDVNEAVAKAAVEKIVYKPSTSQFVGTVGERDEYELTVKRAVGLTNRFGYTTMHIMEDEEGNIFVWTTAATALNEGTKYLVRGTVKDHSVYKGTNQTILTRCKVLKELE